MVRLAIGRTTDGRGLDLSLREARPSDHAALRKLVFGHGPSEWNYLPEAEVGEHLAAVASGDARAVVALRSGHLLGVASFVVGRYPCGPIPHGYGEAIAFVCEVVVHQQHRGLGIGTEMLNFILNVSRRSKLRAVFIDRHADNDASRRMMEAARFTPLLEYRDPARRSNGCGQTAVSIHELF